MYPFLIIGLVHLANKNKKNWMCIIGHPYLQIHPDYQHSNPTCSPLFSDHSRSRFIHIILFIIYYAHLANKKKYKSKGFAAGCSREVIQRGADQLGWDLAKLLTMTLQAMADTEDDIVCT